MTWVVFLSLFLLQVSFLSADRVPLFTTTPVLGGRDVVAYHSLSPTSVSVKGSVNLAYNFTGFQFWFRTNANLKAFQEDPWRYAPAYGGFCSWGMCCEHSPTWPWTRSYLGPPAGVDTAWAIYEGRLYFNIWKGYRHIFFDPNHENENATRRISRADDRWKEWWGGSLYKGPFNTDCFGGSDAPDLKQNWCTETGIDYSKFVDDIKKEQLDPGFFKTPQFDKLLFINSVPAVVEGSNLIIYIGIGAGVGVAVIVFIVVGVMVGGCCRKSQTVETYADEELDVKKSKPTLKIKKEKSKPVSPVSSTSSIASSASSSSEASSSVALSSSD